MYKRENGVSLLILSITVVVLMIIAGVAINSGMQSVKKAELESLKTNMLMLKAKGREYVENANFHYGTGQLTDEQKTEIKNTYLKGTKFEEDLSSYTTLKENDEAYQLSPEDMSEIGLNELKETSNEYVVIYNIENENVDVIYLPGYIYENNVYYTLSSIEEAGI